MDVARAVRRNPYAETIVAEGFRVQVLRGRPRKGESSGPTEVKSVRLPPQVWQALEELAEERGVSLHRLIRTTLQRMLAGARRRAG